jgi:SynChlorMet cassette protein ScmC
VGFLVHPLPTWSGLNGKSGKRSWEIERGLPLRGFFFLEQGEEDESLPLGKAEASVHLWKAGVAGTFHWRSGLDRISRQGMERQLLESAMRAVKVLPGFRLRVSRDGAFWKEMEKAIAACPCSGQKDPAYMRE